jgi:hypothetical protein
MLRLKKKLASTSARDEQLTRSSLGEKILITGSPSLQDESDFTSEDLSDNRRNCMIRWKRKVSFTSSELDSDEEPTQKKARVDNNDDASSLTASFSSSGQRLLSLPGDVNHLNLLHCFVRRNIQLFLASQTDIDALAPGRKKDIFLNQIGIRCIHCMHLPTQDRVKRAVCYPSSISRIYHCVSDMKIDHFTQCSEMPQKLKQHFLALKLMCCKKHNKAAPGSKRPAGNIAGAASTARYYVESAKALGIVQTEQGLFLASLKPEPEPQQVTPSLNTSNTVSPSMSSVSSASSSVSSLNSTSPSSSPVCNTVTSDQQNSSVNSKSNKKKGKLTENLAGVVVPCSTEKPICGEDFSSVEKTDTAKKNRCPSFLQGQEPFSNPTGPTHKSGCYFLPCSLAVPTREFAYDKPMINSFFPLQLPLSNIRLPHRATIVSELSLTELKRSFQASHPVAGSEQQSMDNSRRLLAMPRDSLFLNDLHCFIRKNIEVFSSTKRDVSVPAPGRKSNVMVGQVGLRCIHCSGLPYKDRVKRAVCYPPTVSGIYHCVSNMKFDHFEGCRGFPEESKKQLLELKATCNRKRGSQTANCTAKYYFNAAKKMGLVDTPDGIRFCTEGVGKVADSSSGQGLCDARKQLHCGVDFNGLNALLLAINQSDNNKAEWSQSRNSFRNATHPLPPMNIPCENCFSVPFV